MLLGFALINHSTMLHLQEKERELQKLRSSRAASSNSNAASDSQQNSQLTASSDFRACSHDLSLRDMHSAREALTFVARPSEQAKQTARNSHILGEAEDDYLALQICSEAWQNHLNQQVTILHQLTVFVARQLCKSAKSHAFVIYTFKKAGCCACADNS